MLPIDELTAAIEQLKDADRLIEEQKSRLEFLKDAGESVAEYEKNLNLAIQKRNKFEKAIEKQVAKHESNKRATTSGKR